MYWLRRIAVLAALILAAAGPAYAGVAYADPSASPSAPGTDPYHATVPPVLASPVAGPGHRVLLVVGGVVTAFLLLLAAVAVLRGGRRYGPGPGWADSTMEIPRQLSAQLPRRESALSTVERLGEPVTPGDREPPTNTMERASALVSDGAGAPRHYRDAAEGGEPEPDGSVAVNGHGGPDRIVPSTQVKQIRPPSGLGGLAGNGRPVVEAVPPAPVAVATAPPPPRRSEPEDPTEPEAWQPPDDLLADLVVDGRPLTVFLIGVSGDGPGLPYGWRGVGQAPLAAILPVVLGERDGKRLFVDLGRCPDVMTVVGDEAECEGYVLGLVRQVLANGHGATVLGDLFGDAFPVGGRRIDTMAEVRRLDSPGIVVSGKLSGPDVATARLSRLEGGPVPVLLGDVASSRWSIRLGARVVAGSQRSEAV